MTPTIARLFGRSACAGTLILVLGLLAFKSGKEGLSNLFVHTAHLEIKRWAVPGRGFRGDEWTVVMQYLTKSLHYSPANPWTLEELGTLQLRSMSAARDSKVAVAAARGANASFRMALAQRPTSPFTWASLALSKLYLDEQDEELFLALQRAEELGPWEPAVQQSVTFVGLAVWNRLNPAQRAAVVRAMQRGAQRDAAKITEIARAFNRMDLICATNNNISQGRKDCSQISQSGEKPSRR